MKNLIIKNLKQQYMYGAVGVRDISLECDSGEIISVLSHSEGGKTSLLKAIAGLYPILEGKIYIDGKDVTNLPPKDRNVLLVYEDGGFFNRKSVFYNLSYSLKIRKTSYDIIKDKVLSVARELKIEHLLGEKIFRLSENEKVKVMIARAMLRKASVYLFDDPFKRVLPQDRHAVFIELLPFIKKLDGAVIFATTSVDEARTISERTFIMSYGFVVDEGNFDDLYARPSTLTSYKFVKGYESNIIKAKVSEDEEGVYIDILNKKIKLSSDKLINPIYIGKETIASFITYPAKEGIKHELGFLEYYNNRIILHSKIDNHSIKTVIENKEDISEYIDIDISSLKLFDINSEKLVYFD